VTPPATAAAVGAVEARDVATEGATGRKSGRTGLAAQFRGTRAGLCLHEILERIDFQSDPETRGALIADRLKAHRHLNKPVRAMVETWIDRALGMELIPGLRLSDVKAEDRLVELEFHLPLEKVTPEGLRAVFNESARWRSFGKGDGRGVGVRWNFPGLEGLLKGYVDLVFRHDGLYYLLDWKTNDLGEDPGAYSKEALGKYIVESEYILQYHLYTVAVEQYLRHRCRDHDYETRFGGVLYVFLRGLDPESPGQGVFFDKPDASLVEALRTVIVASARSGRCETGDEKGVEMGGGL
jgi:exodeoxyribonuclease V beta subunit